MYRPGVTDENSSSASAPPPDPTAPPIPTAPEIPTVPPDPVPPAYQPPPGYPAPGYPAGYQAAGYQPPPGYHPGPGSPPPYGYPGYPPPYGYPGYPPPPPADPGTNGFAIAALVTSFLGGSLLSVAFGIVALVQIRKSRQRGRGLAIAGLAIAACWVLLICGALGYVFVQGVRESPNEDNVSVGGGPVPTVTVTADYQLGECLNDLYGPTPKPVSCTTAHPGEIYAIVNLPYGPWPGEESVKKQAELACKPPLDRYLTDHPNLDFTYMYPDESGWPDDRRIICIARDPEGDLRQPLVK
jgi:hypothetical protein